MQDSTIKALVADLVPTARRATAYGVFAAIPGLAALVGGAAVGALYSSPMTLLVVIAISQVIAAALLALVLTRQRRGRINGTN